MDKNILIIFLIPSICTDHKIILNFVKQENCTERKANVLKYVIIRLLLPYRKSGNVLYPTNRFPCINVNLTVFYLLHGDSK